MSDQQSNKPHRAQKDPKKGLKKKLHANGYNAKAFAVAAPGKLERMARRSHDIKEKKYHVPMVDRTPEEPPPVIVAVVGPPGTGKSTLIKSLVRRYTKHTLTEIKGPITVVSGKRRRLTFMECSNDVGSMIDIAKIADLVLLMMDGNFGFEMETMEFLNILAPHGFPRILGVTTHLDLFKNVTTMRNAKKQLKNRFWTEVYQGAKLFYLSGIMNGRYPDREILNLARFISVMKFRPLKWRNEHYYVLADRFVDITHPTLIEKNRKCDRKITLYGYVHGTPMPYENGRVHIPGVGDTTIKEVERLPDPCPTPYFIKQEEQKEGVGKRRKRLDDKLKVLYAPMSDVGGVLMDKDAVYIDVGNQSFVPGQETGIGERLVTGLQSARNVLGQSGSNEGIQIFSTGENVTELETDDEVDDEQNDDEFVVNGGRKSRRKARIVGSTALYEEAADMNDDEEDDDEEDQSDDAYDDMDDKFENLDRDDGMTEEYAFAESDSDLGEDDETVQWKSNLVKNAENRFRANKRYDINKLIYMDIEPEEVLKKWNGIEDDEEEEDIEDEDDTAFFQKKEQAKTIDDDYDQIMYNTELLRQKWSDSTAIKELSDRFYLAPQVEENNENETIDEEEEVYGDFEDIEETEENEAGSEEDGSGDDDDDEEEIDDDGDDDDEADDDDDDDQSTKSDSKVEKTVEEQRAENARKKEKMRLQMEQEETSETLGNKDFEDDEHDTWHDLEKAKIAKQLEINKAVFDEMDQATRDRVEGFRAGVYVRLVLEDIPCEFVDNFDPVYPILIGGLLANEDRFGFSQARIKRHRWHKKLLKTNDPLILSLGWRRFQTIPIYTTSDSRTRNRMLKYTPEHMHCTSTFYGPLVSPNTGFCAFQTVSQEATTGAFRVAATGTIVEVDQSVEIVKKLKLVGYPTKIYKNTAFIRDMFHTSLEVAKFEGAAIKTVSGIRGQIKRALSKPDGHFRATFEDKILMSDIIILRAWHQILPRKFYNPVTSLLLMDKQNWSGMRLTGQVRADMGIELESSENSKYKKIERATRRFNPLKVPKNIQKELPFGSQLHQMKPQKKKTYLQKRAVVVTGEEKKARELMQNLMTLKKDKDAKRQAKKNEQRVQHLKKVAEIEEKRADKHRKEKKEYFAKHGKRHNQDENGGGGKRARR